jgi:pre-mRNA-splicing factor SYF1
LEETLGTVLTCKAVYEKILDLRIASPMTIMNYAAFLKEHSYFEESFKVLLPFPSAAISAPRPSSSLLVPPCPSLSLLVLSLLLSLLLTPQVYEKGVSIFKFPNALDIWLQYLSDFIDRYGGSKIERLRDLFEQSVENVPAEYA